MSEKFYLLNIEMLIYYIYIVYKKVGYSWEYQEYPLYPPVFPSVLTSGSVLLLTKNTRRTPPFW